MVEQKALVGHCHWPNISLYEAEVADEHMFFTRYSHCSGCRLLPHLFPRVMHRPASYVMLGQRPCPLTSSLAAGDRKPSFIRDYDD